MCFLEQKASTLLRLVLGSHNLLSPSNDSGTLRHRNWHKAIEGGEGKCPVQHIRDFSGFGKVNTCAKMNCAEKVSAEALLST